MGTSRRDDIAIIGVSCRFPGAPSMEALWSNLLGEVNSIREIPPDRWDISQYPKNMAEPNITLSKWAGLLDDVDQFDNRFFSISPREATIMDPQQRLLLESTWHCIEDSGVPLRALAGSRTSVFVGVVSTDYREAVLANGNPDGYACLATMESVLPNRISHFFDLRGKSMTVNAACASSLVALHEAKCSLISGDSEYALVGAVNLHLHPWQHISLSKARMLSPDGQCKAFDKDANGFVHGEGVGMLLLQRFDDAVKAGHQIYGVVKGTAVNHGGRSTSVAAPRVAAQRDVILSALRDAGIGAETIGYVEAHGTGTSLGDPIEVEALTQAFRVYTAGKQFCRIGSIKSNIGHLEGAAGLASLIKVLLIMRHRQIPRSLNIGTLNPIIDFEQSPFLVATQTTDWVPLREGIPLRAGVSAFGFAGVNAHVILEEYTADKQGALATGHQPPEKTWNEVPFGLSAKSPESLAVLTEQWRNLSRSEAFATTNLQDLCATVLCGRESFPYRHGAVVRSKDELVQALERWTLDKEATGPAGSIDGGVEVYVSDISWETAVRIHADLGHLAPFQRRLHPALQTLTEQERALFDGELMAVPPSQRALVTLLVGYAYVTTLLDVGLRPRMITGEKLGLLVSLVACGALEPGHSAALISGRMSWEEITMKRPQIPFQDPVTGEVWTEWAVTAPYLQTLTAPFRAGLPKDKSVNANVATAVQRGRLLVNTQFTFHKFLSEWDGVFRTVTGVGVKELLFDDEVLSGVESGNDGPSLLLLIAIASSLRKLNLKWDLTERKLVEDERFVELLDLLADEVMPRDVLATLISDPDPDYGALAATLHERQRMLDRNKGYGLLRLMGAELAEVTDASAWADKALQVSRQAAGDCPCVATGAGPARELLDLWLRGASLNWPDLFPEGTYRKVSLPTYPFERKSFWLTPQDAAVEPVREQPVRPAPAVKTSPVVQRYTAEDPVLADHQITGKSILPGASLLDLGLRVVQQRVGPRPVTLNQVFIQKPGAVRDSSDLEGRLDPDGEQFTVQLDGSMLCRGKFVSAEGQVRPERLDLASFMQSPAEDARSFYSFLADRGYEYGPSLQVMQRVWERPDALLIEVRRTASKLWRHGEGQEVWLSPDLLDGMFQAAVIACHYSGLVVEAEHHDADATLHVPFYLHALTVWAPITQQCYLLIGPGDVQRRGGDLVVRFRAYDETGHPVLEVREMVMKQVSNRFLDDVPANTGKRQSIAMAPSYRPVWREAPLVAEGLGAVSRQPAVIVMGEAEHFRLAEQIGHQYETAFLVAPSGRTFESGAFRPFAVEEGAEAPYDELLESIVTQVGTWSQGIDIYCLWPESDREQVNLRRLFNLMQAIARRGGALTYRVVVRTQNTQVIVPGDSGRGFYDGSLLGLVKTAQLEIPRLKVKLVDFQDRTGEVETAALLMAEQRAADQVELVGYRNGCRHAWAIEAGPATNASDAPVWREDGVYVIAGGAGGIGRQVAESILADVRATVVLLGRSAPSAETRVALERLSSVSGGRAVYVQCDITNADETRSSFAAVRATYGPIRGVINSSGVLRDQLLANKPWSSFRQVLSPKVDGTLNLHEATLHDPLDLFVLFSSIASVIGNAGQADYAAANSFLDAFIHYRSQTGAPGKSLGINWTLWTDGGMGQSTLVQQAFTRKTGLLYRDAALAAFTALTREPGCQYIVVGDGVAFETTAAKFIHSEEISMGQRQGTEEALRRVIGELVVLVASVIGTPVHELDGDSVLKDRGLESSSLAEFTERINSRYKTDLNPALLFQYTTLQSIAGYLLEMYPSNFLTHSSGSAGTASAGEERPTASPVAPAPAPNPASAVRSSAETWARTAATLATGSRPGVLQPRAVVARAERSETDPEKQPTGIAIVGMSSRFPGAETKEEFWQNLAQERDAITEVPADRWDWRAIDGDPMVNPNRSYSRWGGFLRDARSFDAPFFKVTSREAQLMDPQQRLLLEEAWHAVEDAGYSVSDLAGSETGVFIGVSTTDYRDLLLATPFGQEILASTGSHFSIVANRISYMFDFRGPSVAVDTACSSSMIALHQAVQAIRSGDCKAALVGGVNVICAPGNYVTFSQAGMLSRDGRCFTFDKRANGYVRGEGVGVVVLKPLADAVADGDHIYGVIRGTAVNHGGSANTLTSPNPNAQADVIVKAMERAQVDPSTITYLEMHGTGTAVGDPIEVNGLKKAYQELYARNGKVFGTDGRCGLGSVKTNIGHLEAGAGVAGLIKVLLAMRHKTLPASLHLQEINPHIQLEQTPFYIVSRTQPWETAVDASGRRIPRRAGISSFGWGGANVHVVIEEFSAVETEQAPDAGPYLFVLSAKTQQGLTEYARSLLSFLDRQEGHGLSMADQAYSLQVGREQMQERLAIVGQHRHELRTALADFCAGKGDGPGIYRSSSDQARLGRMLQGAEAATLVRSKIAANDLAGLATLWTTGLKVDWWLLHAEANRKRTPMPGYPFDRMPFWLTDLETGKRALPAEAPIVPAVTPARPAVSLPSAYRGDEVRLDVIDGHIAVVTMQDRKNRNMFSSGLLEGLIARFAEIKQDERINVVILTGVDDTFSLGGTREELESIWGRKTRFTDMPFLYRGLLECEVPVISAMQGHAFGGGLVFGLFADFVVMAEESAYSANFMNYGFTPGLAATLVLPEKLGAVLAAEMMFTAQVMQGEELKRRGAPFRFCTQTEVLGEAMRLARVLAEKPVQSLKVLKKELAGRLLAQLPAIVEMEVKMHEQTFFSETVKERINHFFGAEGEGAPRQVARDTAPVSRPEPVVPRSTEAKPAPEPIPSVRRTGLALRPTSNSEVPAPPPVVAAPPQPPVRGGGETGQARPDVMPHVVDVVARLFDIRAQSMDREANFRELGVDSITGVELVREINRTFGLRLESTVIYDHPSVQALVRHVETLLGAVPAMSAASAQEKSGTAKETSPGSVSPDDQLLDLLRRLQNSEFDLNEAERLTEALGKHEADH